MTYPQIDFSHKMLLEIFGGVRRTDLNANFGPFPNDGTFQ